MNNKATTRTYEEAGPRGARLKSGPRAAIAHEWRAIKAEAAGRFGEEGEEDEGDAEDGEEAAYVRWKVGEEAAWREWHGAEPREIVDSRPLRPGASDAATGRSLARAFMGVAARRRWTCLGAQSG